MREIFYIDNPYVTKAFLGIRIVVVALIAEAVCKLWKTAIKTGADLCFFAIALILSLAGLPIVVIMLLFCVVGFIRGWQRGWK